jgi:hypothetical protein
VRAGTLRWRQCRERAMHPDSLRGTDGILRGAATTDPLRSPASQVPRPPVSRPRLVGIRPTGPLSDRPRVIAETRCESSSSKWWPRTESNHRHADFQNRFDCRTAAGHYPSDRRVLGVDLSSTLAIRVCQPGPVAFHLAITSGGSRSDRSLRGCCNFGRPLRTSFSPRYKSAPAIHSSVISGGSLVADEMRTEPFRFALMTMPHADDAPGRTARCPDEHDQP